MREQFELRPHIHCEVSVLGASWNSAKQRWVVRLKDLKTGQAFVRESDVFISCVGAISVPKDCTIPGHESFKGEIWHSARWNHDYDYRGKRIAVIGNGCSAAQFVPALVDAGAQVTQFARSAQWYHPRPNHVYSAFEKACFKYVPGLMWLYRLRLFFDTDNLLLTYLSSPAAERERTKIEAESKAYMESKAPAKYHKELLPSFPLGCKRRVFDPGYLECLNKPNIELLSEGIERLEENKIVSSSGKEREVDAVVLATGYKVQEFLTPLEVVGEDGKSLTQHWKETRGAQAYHGTFVSHMPNFAIICELSRSCHDCVADAVCSRTKLVPGAQLSHLHLRGSVRVHSQGTHRATRVRPCSEDHRPRVRRGPQRQQGSGRAQGDGVGVGLHQLVPQRVGTQHGIVPRLCVVILVRHVLPQVERLQDRGRLLLVAIAPAAWLCISSSALCSAQRCRHRRCHAA